MFRFFSDFILTIYQCIIPVYMIKKQVHQRKHSFFYECITVTLMLIYLLSIQYFSIPLPDTLVFIFPFLFIRLISDEQFMKCLFWIVLDAFLYMGTLSLVSGLFDVSIAVNGSSTAAEDLTLFQYSLVGKSALAIMAVLVTKGITNQFSISPKETLLLIVTLGINFGISECFFLLRTGSPDNNLLIVGSACSFISLILIIVLYECLTDITQKKQQVEQNLRTASIISEHQDELKTIYTNMLAEQHDLKHRIAVAEELLASRHLNEIEEKKILEFLHSDKTAPAFITGNTAVDAILKAKTTVMFNAGIHFVYIDYPLNTLPISEQQFCMLLGNLLDNAIEGVMRVPASETNRSIRLSISKIWEMYFISCSNSADIHTIKKNGDTFISSKPHPEVHGFGTENMKQIVETAGGTIEFIVEANRFTVEIMIGGKYPC